MLLLLAVAAGLVVLVGPWPSSSSPSSSTTPLPRLRGERLAPVNVPAPLGPADGAIPDGTTVFDDGVPGVARLDPALLDALRRAATDADRAFTVVSGWRSAAYQEQLLRDAVAQYGSRDAAARWVATPQRSAHVSGDAVDLGADAPAWLAEHGAAYGLCPVYANEPWHVELRPDAAAAGCPTPYPDPTHDPRMHT